MTTELPKTSDGLVFDSVDQADRLIASLHALERHIEAQRARAIEADSPQVREDHHATDEVLACVWRAIGLAEGAREALENAKHHRAHCVP